MSKSYLPACAALLLAAAVTLPAMAQDKCAPETVSAAVEKRLQGDGKSPSDIADILGSGFKRGILAGKIEDASGCSDSAVKSALDLLAQKYK
ncbi:MAG: hypothetical protein RIB84_10095 [Sneathiellaceae bacterium]